MKKSQPMTTAPRDVTVVDLWVIPVPGAPPEFTRDHLPHRVADTIYSDYRWIGAEWPWMPVAWMSGPDAPPDEMVIEAVVRSGARPEDLK